MTVNPTTSKESQDAPGSVYGPMLFATVAFSLVDILWGLLEHWTFAIRELYPPLVIMAVFLCPLILRRYRSDIKLSTACIAAAVFQTFTAPAGVLSYFVVSTNAPLIDNLLDGWDKMLGFDWPAYFLWIVRHPWIDQVLSTAYTSVVVQTLFVVVYLSFTERRAQLKIFMSAFTVSSVITLVVSGFFPAGAASLRYQSAVHSNVSMLSDFFSVRNGTLKAIYLSQIQGLISMPSFHTIMAILLAYAMRGTKLSIVFWVLNFVVILSIPSSGGHYLVDVFGGVLTVIGTIWIVRSQRFDALVRRTCDLSSRCSLVAVRLVGGKLRHGDADGSA